MFAARTPHSKYPDRDFLVGNIFTSEVAPALDAYDFHHRYTVGANIKCGSCTMNASCGKGCPGGDHRERRIYGEVSREQCPVPDGSQRLLQIGRPRS